MAQSQQHLPHTSAMRIAGGYALFGVLWILLSDRIAVRMVTTEAQLTFLQTIKGWAFVLFSAALLYGMVVREHRRLVDTNEQLETALQQAHILHRILRHNLRNICAIMGGTIDTLDVETDGRQAKHLDTLWRQNSRLINLSEKCRYLRDFLTADVGEARKCDLVELVEREVAKAREKYPVGRIETTLPPEAHINAHHLLSGAIEELIENAIEHNPTKNPTVWVSVRTEEERTTLTIEDNGPGIPASEISALKQMYESPLLHSQGIGLWLVQLTVKESDGEITFEESEHGGTSVQITLPVANRSELSRVI